MSLFKRKCKLCKSQNNSIMSVICPLIFSLQFVYIMFLHSFVVIYLCCKKVWHNFS